MSDIIDRACELEMLQRDMALECNELSWMEDHGADGDEQCTDCGELIPEARRLAAPGCRRCIDCQEFSEYLRQLRSKR